MRRLPADNETESPTYNETSLSRSLLLGQDEGKSSETVSPTGPNGRTLQYAADGLTFTVLKRDLKRQPNAPGLFRSDLSGFSNSDQLPPWGIGMVHGPDPYLVRFDCDWDQQ